jgi:D-glycerate 3-kinase
LELRGNAGSHDLAIGTKTLAALKECNNNKDKNNRTSSSSGGVKLPRYDKSAFSGRGDRASPDTWPQVHPPLEIILLEGWMLGFKAVPDQQAQQIDPNLTPVNTYLHEYTNAWDSYVDCWLVVKVSSPEFAFRWRLQAEQAQRAAGKPAMTDEQVKDFVSRYMPAYKAYLPGLYEKGPTTGAGGKVLVVEVNEERDPASVQPKPIM